jgi:hypothetical protein
VGQDQPRIRVARRQVGRVASERRDAAAGVDDDRQPALGRQLEDRRGLGVGQPERLRARVQLDPARTRCKGTLGLRDGIGARIDAAERHEPATGLRALPQDPVVCIPVSIRVGEREDDRAPVDQLERLDQAVGPQREAVGVLPARVRVHVERLDTGHKRAQGVVPGDNQLVGVHQAA